MSWEKPKQKASGRTIQKGLSDAGGRQTKYHARCEGRRCGCEKRGGTEGEEEGREVETEREREGRQGRDTKRHQQPEPKHEGELPPSRVQSPRTPPTHACTHACTNGRFESGRPGVQDESAPASNHVFSAPSQDSGALTYFRRSSSRVFGCMDDDGMDLSARWLPWAEHDYPFYSLVLRSAGLSVERYISCSAHLGLKGLP